MAGLARFQWTDKDHEAIVADVVARIKETYGEGRWSDFEEDSSGVMLLEAFAYITDLLLFYLDHQANETYLATAQERQNLINIAKLIGYKVSGARPASVDIMISRRRGEATGRSVVIPKGTKVRTKGGMTFETSADAVIPAGGSSVVVAATEGETFDEAVGTGTGESDLEIYLPRAGVIEIGRVEIAGHEWTAVDGIATARPGERVYTAELDAWGRARLTFGDGRRGRIPGADDEIRVRYRVGGGAAGNVAPRSITSIEGTFTDELGGRAELDVDNEGWAVGGRDPETARSIRINAPRFFETQMRCVTQGDYEAFALAFQDPEAGAIVKARAIVRERSGEANVIRIYALAPSSAKCGVGPLPLSLKTALKAHLDRYKMLTDWIEIEDGRWRAVDVEGTVRIGAGVTQKDAKSAITAAVGKLFDIDVREMGEPLRISDLYAAIDGAAGVIHVELDAPRETVEADKDELLTLGELRLTFEAEGAGMDGKNI